MAKFITHSQPLLNHLSFHPMIHHPAIVEEFPVQDSGFPKRTSRTSEAKEKN
jgi:hypothetical protein